VVIDVLYATIPVEAFKHPLFGPLRNSTAAQT
jgi:hypothetical protein